MKQLKILIIVDSLVGSGGEVASLALADGMLALGIETHLLYFHNNVEQEVNPDLKCHLIDIKPYRILPKTYRYQVFAKMVDRYIKAKIGRLDLIISNLNQSNLIMSYSKLERQLYVIHSTFSKANDIDIASVKTDEKSSPSKVFEQLSDNDKKAVAYYRKIYAKHPCVCVSHGVEKDFQRFFGDITQTQTIYNAFDKQKIEQAATEFVPSEDNYIIHVGSFYPVKAHKDLLMAYANSSQKYSLMLIGKGKLEAEIKELAVSLEIDRKVIFKGYQSNPFPYIKHAKGLVLSSHYEGLGRVLVEAQALAVPAISTDCPSGPSELLPAHCLVPVADIDALSSKLTDLMANPQKYMSSFNSALLPTNIAKQYLQFMSLY